MSKSSRVVVLGANGLLGTHVAAAIEKSHSFELRRQQAERFTSSTELLRYLSGVDAGTVVNCIGYKGTDAAMHFQTNGCLPRSVADWAAAHGALAVHISTNAVFEASEDRFWQPSDHPSPRTPYEVSKAYGEDPRSLVIRVSFIGVAGSRPGILADLLDGRPYWNRRWNGVTASALAKRVARIVEDHHGTAVSGIEHVHSSTVTDFATIARLVNSASLSQGERRDARLLAGGLEMPSFDMQLAEEIGQRG
jgi:dTDP-4-dehydrorhamnose reductase